MTTAFQTGPGFFAAETSAYNKAIPPSSLRIYCARIEAYDLPEESADMDNIQFEILFAKAEKDPQIAHALLKLRDTINENEPLLRALLKKKR